MPGYRLPLSSVSRCNETPSHSRAAQIPALYLSCLSYNLSEAQQAGRTVSDPHARDSGASFTLVDAWTLLKTLDLTQEAPAKQGAHPVWPLAHREGHEAWVCSVTRFGGTVFPQTAWCVKPS